MFTGSTSAGKEIAKSCAKHLTPMCLELGEKNPAVVYKDVKVKHSSRRLAWGKFVNAGQTCIAPDCILAHKDVYNYLVNSLKDSIESFYGQNSLTSPDYCGIIDDNNYQRLKKYLDFGDIIYGGKYSDVKRKISPTLIINPDLESKLMTEEIFGPILPILKFDEEQEAIDYIQTKDKPLAFYLFTEDEGLINKYLENLSFGGACLNDTLIHYANTNLPFGGVGKSDRTITIVSIHLKYFPI